MFNWKWTVNKCVQLIEICANVWNNVQLHLNCLSESRSEIVALFTSLFPYYVYQWTFKTYFVHVTKGLGRTFVAISCPLQLTWIKGIGIIRASLYHNLIMPCLKYQRHWTRVNSSYTLIAAITDSFYSVYLFIRSHMMFVQYIQGEKISIN